MYDNYWFSFCRSKFSSLNRLHFQIPLLQLQEPENSILKSVSKPRTAQANTYFQHCFYVMGRRHQGVLTPAPLCFLSPVFTVSHFFDLLVLRGFLAMKRVAVWSVCDLNGLSYPQDWPIHASCLFALMTKKDEGCSRAIKTDTMQEWWLSKSF